MVSGAGQNRSRARMIGNRPDWVRCRASALGRAGWRCFVEKKRDRC